ncbi:Zinc finger BED domain-containing protein RICESLEEPER 2 [Euphorbia peplus]|nr:Zinc finger BED domain-containing protein RICESLEEPER 2 [Euphorbia peplus]
MTKKPRHASSHSELDIYLTTIFEFEESNEFDILDWWKRHARTFPTLAKIAAQILTVPASTVAVEQTFSRGGHILDPKRSKLAPESLESQVCLNDWKRAELRTQSNIVSSSSSDEWVGDPTTISTTSESESN